MATRVPAMFRQEALEYRLSRPGSSQEVVTFPRWMSRRIATALWIMLLLLAVGGGAACFVSVPVTASGLAIAADNPAVATDSAGVAALMPAGSLPRLEAGQPAEIFPGPGSVSIGATIVAVEPVPFDVVELEQQFGLPAAALSSLGESVALVWVTLDSPAAEQREFQGFGRVELEAGSRPAGAFVPLVERLFGDDA